MQIRKLLIAYLILILLTSSVLTIAVYSQEPPHPTWDINWSYRQELYLPISTDKPSAKYQPIDILLEFNNPCWAKNENDHSVRIVCWDGKQWHELESQIYDLEHVTPSRIRRCGVIFLVPVCADGNERYFVFYDDDAKNNPNYKDHVSIKDAYYYFEPISGIKVEGDYYKILEDEYCVFGVGQKGEAINRRLSQAILIQKPKTKEFGILTSDISTSFSFSYYVGEKEKDEISSDQKLVSKEIQEDGNLMVKFKIVSESSDKNLRTTNTYKYYYCPTSTKRISVHVKHQVLQEGKVKGIINVDGRYGAFATYHSKSERIGKIRFGEILPYIHVYGENDKIKEYHMNLNPENKEREWIIPYTDDCDIGKEAWISHDEGETGKAHGVIFSSNENIVKRGKNERDGIQVKVNEREYLDMLGAEIDYAAINFGRNSYEKGGKHDLDIPDDLIVEFDAEFFSSQDGGYKSVIEETKYFHALIKHRHNGDNGPPDDNQNIYTLTVIPRFTGRFFSSPWLANITGFNISYVSAELYHDGEFISEGVPYISILGPPKIKFPKLSAGKYIIKMYRKIGQQTVYYIGFESVTIDDDTTVDIYCTWPKSITITARDQNGNNIKNIQLLLYKNDTIISSNVTELSSNTVFNVPFNLINPYILKCIFKGFIIYDKEIPKFEKIVELNFNLYDLTIDIKDKLGFCPGVNVRPFLTSSKMEEQIEISPEDMGFGKYIFKELIESSYDLHISFGGFSDTFQVEIPNDLERKSIRFDAMFELNIEILDSRGSLINDKQQNIKIIRNGKTIFESLSPGEVVSLPPGGYKITVYSDNRLVGIKNIELTNNKNIKIVTKITSIIPTLMTILVIIFIIEIIVLILIKKISLNTFMKLLAMVLILLSLVQPWWVLNASSNNPIVEKNSEMYIVPQTMIETIIYKEKSYLDLATIPNMFSDFVGILLLVVYSGFILMGISFIPNIILKRRFYMILIAASVLFLILVSVAFSYGMSIITEVSLGSLQGEGILNVILPDGETVNMSSNWGLGIGFYLCIISALTAMFAGIIDYLRRGKWRKQLFKEK